MKLTGLTKIALLLVAGAGLATTAWAADFPGCDEIMKKINGGKGYHRLLKKQLATPETDWEKVQAECKDYAKLAAALVKNDPPKGDKASWKKLCDEYTADAAALNSAAEKKDKAGTLAAHKKLDKSCKECHEKHQPE